MCVVGLDGVPCTLLERFIHDGTMPRMADLAEKGCFRRMKVTLPEISMVSWSSFMSGVGPEKHGIFGFTSIRPGSYDLCFPSFRDLRAPTIWDRVAEAGKKSVVINQPATYPARQINGALVSGFVAIDLNKSVYPMLYADSLRAFGYELDIDTQKARHDSSYLFRKLLETLSQRRLAANLFWEKVDWDYFELVITGTDRLMHYQWDALEDTSHPNREAVLDYFRKVDRFVGRQWDMFRQDARRDDPERGFFLLSDHGFMGIKQEVYLNAWLESEGYLKYSTDSPKSWNDLADETRAFAIDPSRIHINLRGKYPKGSVDPLEVPALKTEISGKLRSLRCDGEATIKDVFDADQLYPGSTDQTRPDLVALGMPGYDLKGSVKERRIFARTDLQGMHTWDDAFFWSAEEIEGDLRITDLARIILQSLED